MAREKIWLTPAEACREYKIPRSTFYYNLDKGYLHGKLLRGKCVYHRKHIERCYGFAEERIN